MAALEMNKFTHKASNLYIYVSEFLRLILLPLAPYKNELSSFVSITGVDRRRLCHKPKKSKTLKIMLVTFVKSLWPPQG